MPRIAASMCAMRNGRGVGTILFTRGFWVVVIVGIVARIRQPVSQGKQSRSNAALDALRRPYAHGEIKSEEFEARTGDPQDG